MAQWHNGKSVSSRNFLSGYHCTGSWTCQFPINANPASKSSYLLAATQKRWASQAATAEEDNKISIGPHREGQPEYGNDDKETEVVYYGPISSTIKKVKLLSLSVSLGPVITFMTSPETNVILKHSSINCYIL